MTVIWLLVAVLFAWAVVASALALLLGAAIRYGSGNPAPVGEPDLTEE